MGGGPERVRSRQVSARGGIAPAITKQARLLAPPPIVRHRGDVYRPSVPSRWRCGQPSDDFLSHDPEVTPSHEQKLATRQVDAARVSCEYACW